jgi:hypothetical protein
MGASVHAVFPEEGSAYLCHVIDSGITSHKVGKTFSNYLCFACDLTIAIFGIFSRVKLRTAISQQILNRLP